MFTTTTREPRRVAQRSVHDRGGLKAHVILWDCRHMDGFGRPTDWRVEHSPTGHYAEFLLCGEARAALNLAAYDPAQVIPALRGTSYDAKEREVVPEGPS